MDNNELKTNQMLKIKEIISIQFYLLSPETIVSIL